MQYEFVTRMNVERGSGHKWLRFGLNFLIIAGFIILIDRFLEGNFDWIILLLLAGLVVFRLVLGGGSVYREVPVNLGIDDDRMHIIFAGIGRVGKDNGDKECKINLSDIRKILFHQKAGLLRIDAQTKVKVLNAKKNTVDEFTTQRPLVFFLPENVREETLQQIGQDVDINYVGQQK